MIHDQNFSTMINLSNADGQGRHNHRWAIGKVGGSWDQGNTDGYRKFRRKLEKSPRPDDNFSLEFLEENITYCDSSINLSITLFPKYQRDCLLNAFEQHDYSSQIHCCCLLFIGSVFSNSKFAKGKFLVIFIV